MAITGPTTRDTSTLALGLAQIRVIASATHIGKIKPQAVATDSIGSLANTKFTGSVDYWRHYSGFPQLEDHVIPLQAACKLECAFEEIKPYTMALARGIDPTSESFTSHSGEVPLGELAAPEYVRMEAHYVFPNGSNTMDIIFPRAQVTSEMSIDLQKQDGANVPITFESKRADSLVSGGSGVWDDKPLGRIVFG